MENLTNVSIWELWLSGNLEKEDVFLGLELFWWGRIGKAMQSFALIVVLIEIIGAEKIALFGEGLGRVEFYRKTLKRRAAMLKVMKHMLSSFSLSDEELADKARKNTQEEDSYLHNTFRIMILVSSLSAFITFIWAADYYNDESLHILTLPMLAFSASIFLTVIGISLLIWIYFIILVFLKNLIINPIVFLLTRKKLDFVVKIITLITAVVGLFFDFLSS